MKLIKTFMRNNVPVYIVPEKIAFVRRAHIGSFTKIGFVGSVKESELEIMEEFDVFIDKLYKVDKLNCVIG